MFEINLLHVEMWRAVTEPLNFGSLRCAYFGTARPVCIGTVLFTLPTAERAGRFDEGRIKQKERLCTRRACINERELRINIKWISERLGQLFYLLALYCSLYGISIHRGRATF